jgi:hypothetical protein
MPSDYPLAVDTLAPGLQDVIGREVGTRPLHADHQLYGGLVRVRVALNDGRGAGNEDANPRASVSARNRASRRYTSLGKCREWPLIRATESPAMGMPLAGLRLGDCASQASRIVSLPIHQRSPAIPVSAWQQLVPITTVIHQRTPAIRASISDAAASELSMSKIDYTRRELLNCSAALLNLTERADEPSGRCRSAGVGAGQ